MVDDPSVSSHDDRPFGVPIARDQLRIDDLVEVTLEAQMMGQPTGVFVQLKQVRYRGEVAARHQFDSDIESHYVTDHEIVKVVLVDPE